MADGWRCPVCGRGVAPGEKVCDHGGLSVAPVYPLPAWPPVPAMPYVPDCGCPPGQACGLSGCPRMGFTFSGTAYGVGDPFNCRGGAGGEGVPAGTDGYMRWG